MVTCRRCLGVVPAEEVDYNRRTGRGSICRSCYKQKQKEYYERNKPRCLAKMREYYAENKEKLLPKIRAYNKANRGKFKVYAHREAVRLRQQAIAAYGGKCACCGEIDWRFLTLDHVDGNGKAELRKIGHDGGRDWYRWLRQREWPKQGLQVLCMNCNVAKYWYGVCPHQEAAVRAV